MAKSIHQQIIDGKGTISLKGIEREFDIPECMRIAQDALQDEDTLIEVFKSFKGEGHPEGILLNVLHQALGQMRVNWSADVKGKAIEKIKNENGKVMREVSHFATIATDCSYEWIPPVQGLPKVKAKDMSLEEMYQKLADEKGLPVEAIRAFMESQPVK